jgi:hypothetical protein
MGVVVELATQIGSCCDQVESSDRVTQDGILFVQGSVRLIVAVTKARPLSRLKSFLNDLRHSSRSNSRLGTLQVHRCRQRFQTPLPPLILEVRHPTLILPFNSTSLEQISSEVQVLLLPRQGV